MKRTIESSSSTNQYPSPFHKHCADRISIIGAGINGLVAANYLAREGGYDVTLLEREPQVGGACVERTMEINGQTYRYPGGASVFGLMQDFVFEETGLAKRLQTYCPEGAYGMILKNQPHTGLICSDDDLRKKCGERGDIDAYHNDEERVIAFLRKGYRAAIVPTLEIAQKELGPELTNRFISGSARELADHYFTSEAMKMYTISSSTVSGPNSIDNPYSALTIPLMYSGSVFDGSWGFVRGGIWNIVRELDTLNRKAGVRTITDATVVDIDPRTRSITYIQEGKEHITMADRIIFATEPVHAAKLLQDRALSESISGKDFLGTSGKTILFFRSPIQWKEQSPDDAMLRFVFAVDTLDEFERATLAVKDGTTDFAPGYFELYPEGAGNRAMRLPINHDYLSVFFKNVALGKTGAELPSVQEYVRDTILAQIRNPGDYIGSTLLTPTDLQQQFKFAQGNIDHIELTEGQTFFARTYSTDPHRSFYQFGGHPNIYYAGAGTYPCGSIAGTPGYMCAKQIMGKRK